MTEQTVEEYVLGLAADVVRIKELTLSAAKALMKDTTRPLDKRWEVFTKLSEASILPEHSSSDGHVDLLERNLSLYDDFSIEKYETTRYVDILERAEDYADDDHPLDIARWKEAVLAKGYGSFTYDW